MEHLPEHIGIIMDGNGRWAKKRSLPRIMGHRAGTKSLMRAVETCAKIGVKALTVYAFSTENWSRPRKEVDALMGLLERSVGKYLPKLKKNNIRFNCIGRINALPKGLVKKLRNLTKETSGNTGLILTLALNYGARQEITDAVLAVIKKNKNEKKALAIDENDINGALYTEGLPELDLIIHTSGEMRLSNFLLWQAAYAEFYFTDTLWPDFGETELKKALAEYGRRERRFGGE